MSEEINKLTEEYDKLVPEVYICDYFQVIKNKVENHLKDLEKKIHENSDKLIGKLKRKEKVLKSNARNLVKLNLERSKKDLEFLKHSLRKIDLKQDVLKDILSKINQKIRELRNETKQYTNSLLMNEAIYFEKHKKRISHGKLYFYANKSQVLSNNCGDIIKSFNQHTERVNSIQVDEKSNKLISASNDKTIKIWNLNSGECLKTLNDHQDSVTSILITSTAFISGSIDKTVKIWDLNTYECLETLENNVGVSSLCLMPNNQIACGGFNGYINIWSLKNSGQIKEFKAHNDYISGLLLVDEAKLVSCSTDKKIKIWSLKDIFKKSQALERHTGAINNLELALDGNLLSSSLDNTVKLWRIETGEELKSIEFKKQLNSVISLNEDLILVAIEDQIVVSYLKKEPEILISILTHSSHINHLVLLKNGNLVSCSEDGQIKLSKMLDSN